MKSKSQLLKYLLSFILLITLTNSFLEFTLLRNKNQETFEEGLTKTDECINKSTFKEKTKKDDDDEVEYDELCYFKDISYSIELYHNNQLHHIAIDLTSPYSWLKSTNCKIVESGKSCHLIEQGEVKEKKSSHKKLKTPKLDEPSKNHISQEKNSNEESEEKSEENDHDEPTQNKLARIEGSNQLVEGYLEQNKDIEFWTKDSGRLSRLFDILMLGFYMIEEKEKVTLHRTNFINTTKLSENMNLLSDGALSLRFDENSENSFLDEIFDYTQTVDKMITIYINDKESELTIGELSIKNTAEGFSGIVWVPFDNNEDNTAYGKLPLVQSIMLESLAKDQEQDIEKDEDNSIFVVFSLSASYIGLPETAMNELTKQFKDKHKLDCSISQYSYFECTSSHNKEEILTENLLIVMKEGAISLPLESLVLKKSKKKIILNLRLISKEENEKEKSFIILGEPYFQKYFTALDYHNNRVGFAIKRTGEHNNFISTVSLIRFVSLIFFAGCCFLICFQPIKKMFETFGGKPIYSRKSPEGRRLKYQPIEENPYEEVSDNLKKVMEENDQNQ